MPFTSTLFPVWMRLPPTRQPGNFETRSRTPSRASATSFKDVAKHAGEGLKDYFDTDIKDAIKGYGKNLRDEVRSGDVHGALEDIRRPVEHVTDLVTGLGRAFGAPTDGVESFGRSISGALSDLQGNVDDITGKLHSVKDTLHAFKTGDLGSGVGGLTKLFGDDVPGLGEAKGFFDRFDETKQSMRGFVGDTKEMAEMFSAAAP